MRAKHTSRLFAGFLGNGTWLFLVHTKKCGRERRNVTPAARARTLVINHQEQFVVAMRARAAISKALGETA